MPWKEALLVQLINALAVLKLLLFLLERGGLLLPAAIHLLGALTL